MTARAAPLTARHSSLARRRNVASRAVTSPPVATTSAALLGEDLSILSAAVERAELTEALTGGKSLTVFAPSDAAFAKVCEDLQLSKEEVLDLENLADILTYHVVEGGGPCVALIVGDDMEKKMHDTLFLLSSLIVRPPPVFYFCFSFLCEPIHPPDNKRAHTRGASPRL